MSSLSLSFDDILLEPRFSNIESRLNVSLETSLGSLKIKSPIMSSPMDCVTDSFFSQSIYAEGGTGIIHRFMDTDTLFRHIENMASFKVLNPGFKVCFSVGIGSSELDRFKLIFDEYGDELDLVLVDVANGFSSMTRDMVYSIKNYAPNIHVMAGNVSCNKGFKFLADSGADSVRVGIGGGSVCKTRIMTGFGLPTLETVIRCSRFKELNSEYSSIGIVADGGIRYPSDVVKSLAMGADAVIMGSVFAKTGESCSQKIFLDGKRVSVYRGMASKEFQDDKKGGLKEGTCAEGVQRLIPVTHSLSEVMQEFLGGLRSGLTYAGCSNIYDLKGSVKYSVVSNSGLKESHPHAKGV